MNTTIPGSRAQGGFTLMELMIAVGVLAILLGVAAPSLRETMMNVRMSAHANDLGSDLALARTEAVKRGIPVRLCPSNVGGTNCAGSNWSVGWIVFVDTNNDGTLTTGDLVLRYRARTNTDITISLAPSAGNLPFRPTGVSNAGGGAVNEVFTLCDGRTGRPNGGRVITVSPTGRSVITRIAGC